jgi:hypothetical protein
MPATGVIPERWRAGNKLAHVVRALVVLGGLVVVSATLAGAASAQRRDLVLHPGQTRTFIGVHRGDTVSCKGLRLTVQMTPSYAHIRGATRRRLIFRYADAAGLVLSVATPQQHRVAATCERR